MEPKPLRIRRPISAQSQAGADLLITLDMQKQDPRRIRSLLDRYGYPFVDADSYAVWLRMQREAVAGYPPYILRAEAQNKRNRLMIELRDAFKLIGLRDEEKKALRPLIRYAFAWYRYLDELAAIREIEEML